MTVRFLYGEFFNFVPTFKIFMATNHKPEIKGTDYKIWWRIKLIPFTTRIEEKKQDKELEEKLWEEASGILNWLLAGIRRGGLTRLPPLSLEQWTLPHLVDRKISMDYKQEGAKDGQKGRRAAKLLERVQGRGGGAGRKAGKTHKPDSR
jgi:hypothetical protein